MLPKAAIVDARTLRQRLIASRIARSEDIAGCSGEEVAALEQRLGPLPDSYKAVLGEIGRGAGRLVDDKELWIYADQLEKVNRLAREQIFEDGEDSDDPVPEDAVFIGARYGEHPWFILAGNGADSPVWHCDTDTGHVTRIDLSVWDWVEGIVHDAEYFIDKALPSKTPDVAMGRRRRRGPARSFGAGKAPGSPGRRSLSVGCCWWPASSAIKSAASTCKVRPSRSNRFRAQGPAEDCPRQPPAQACRHKMRQQYGYLPYPGAFVGLYDVARPHRNQEP